MTTVNFTLLDLLLVALLAGITAAGVRRGIAGLAAGAATITCWFAANQLGDVHPLLAVAVALGAGLAVGRFSSALEPVPAGNLTGPQAALGGLGGLLAGLGLVAALALSFPTYTNPSDAYGRFEYPSSRVPVWLLQATRDSAIQRFLSEPRERGGLGVWTGSEAVRGLLLPDH